jgi:hypothetical protein
MYKLSKEKGFEENIAREIFIVELLHDIGCNFTEDERGKIIK